jgi:ribosome maturation factor RimP
MNQNLSHPIQPETSGAAPRSAEERLLDALNGILSPLQYEVVHLEVQTHREKILRIFIDWTENLDSEKTIGIEDCAKVSKALDEPLEALAEVEALFKGTAYELEVSSPGVDRPLRREQDYLRFSGRKIRLNTFRPLNGEELGDAGYAAQNPRQKNFMGELLGLETQSVLLKSSIGGTRIRIPLSLVAKANLDPEFDFEDKASKKAKSHKAKEGVKA